MKLIWFGHSAIRIEFGRARVLIDPFLSGNPAFTGDAKKAAAGCTHLLLTHGHSDHVGDTVAILKETGAQLVANYEICAWLAGQGAQNVNYANHGGTVDCGGFTVSLVVAFHSSATDSGVYLGNPAGLIVKSPGEPTLYHMGDTEIFSDMALIDEIHRPEIGIVPIGDRFTMGARTAAMACKRFFKFRTIIPCHYATFPLLDQSADKFLAEMGSEAGKVVVPERGLAIDL